MAQPTPVWDTHLRKYLITRWNGQHKCDERLHHDGSIWVHYDWCPTSARGASGASPQPTYSPTAYSQTPYSQTPYSQTLYSQAVSPQMPYSQTALSQTPHSQTSYPQNAYLQTGDLQTSQSGQYNYPSDSSFNPRERGDTVRGTWNASQGTRETLDPSYCVREPSFFQLGRVFSALFSEAVGQTITQHSDCVSYVKFNEQVYSQIRRFIVVKVKREFCFAIPIFTYRRQGTKKPGVVASEHAIAYSQGTCPTLLPGEENLEKSPICIITNPGLVLDPSSRVYFGIHHPIQKNVKVKDIGTVDPKDLGNLLGYWSMENQSHQSVDSYDENEYES